MMNGDHGQTGIELIACRKCELLEAKKLFEKEYQEVVVGKSVLQTGYHHFNKGSKAGVGKGELDVPL